jgi:putative SOS response-associated peptidase YedK
MPTMCSRYELKPRPGDLARRFRLREEPPDLARPEVRPTDPAVIVVRAEDGSRFARLAGFGLSVTWDRAPRQGRIIQRARGFARAPVINARAETLTRKPTFRPLLANRCLVPASAYFEWRQDGRARRRNRIALEGEALMGFAGLFDADRFVIITCAPTAALAHVHNRMPVILPPEAEEPWLDANNSDALAALLAPYAQGIAAVEEKPSRPPQGDLFGGG